MSSSIFEEIARRCSISDALSITGLSLKDSGGREVGPPSESGSYRSPFRDDSKPSFSLFRDKSDQHWCFKDHATGDAGNMIIFVKLGCGLTSNGDAAALIDRKLNLNLFKKPKVKSSAESSGRLKNVKLDVFTHLHAELVASVVGVIGTGGIRRVYDRGILGVGTLFRYGRNGSYPETDCFFLYDQSTKSATSRKLNEEKFGSLKSVTPNDWHKLPIGLSAIHPTAVYGEVDEAVFCEGEKDLIAVMHGVSHERSIPICMPSATTTLKPEHAERFANMTCTIYAQADAAGIVAALDWYQWLQPHAFQVRVRVPLKNGDDWADLANGCTSSEVESLLSARVAFNEFVDDEILTLTPDVFPKEKAEPIKAKKSGGSPLDVDNMKRVYEAWESLDDDGKESVSEVCKVLSVSTRERDRAKVVRGLDNCFKAIYFDLLMRRMGIRLHATPMPCNYSENVAVTTAHSDV
jgi:hypothetical protein